ncbi:MAG: 4Fe-4S binding protein [Coriobacteriia bacterium]|nr:4Fe-4S binding protein [Coriobacteriia bacterium]
MDKTSDNNLLATELVKRCNPGLTDFGTGSVIAMSSQCLRSAKQATECQICIEACPVDAITATVLQRPIVTRDCLKCGYCISLCPTNAIAATTLTHQQLIRVLLQATLRVEHLAITCSRSFALLRLESESSDPEAAQAALTILKQAEVSENLFVVPCLAILSSELWFTALNEIGVTSLNHVSVYLPPGQCDLCPVNCKDGVVDTFADSIDRAERWSNQSVSIINSPEDVPQYQKPSVRDYLVRESEADRREAFTGLYGELKRTLDDSNRTGNRSADEAILIRARRQTLSRTLLAEDLQNTFSGSKKPILSSHRQALVEAIGRNPANASSVTQLVSQTDSDACDACGTCVEACALKARSIENGVVYADPLYCLGCSACIQACPQKACSFSLISGETFLRV